MANSTVEVNSPALQEATKKSTLVWRKDLEALFHHAKDRFPDVVWELGEEDGDEQEVWGHKAIVYARAPPSFQTRYFSVRPTPYASSPPPTTSALSLDISRSSRSPSPFRSSSPASMAPTGLLRLSTSINPALFSNELEYLYTGQGFGEAFEFLYDSAESTHDEAEAEEMRIDKLRKDLVFMWRSRLYSDVRISLTGNFSSSNHENTTAIFSSHRFVLVSRSPYFHTALIAWPNKPEQQVLTLPSPPFTPASLHFTLGFIYTGTLIFSHRSYDLDTAFHIMRSATYLSLSTLYDEIQARIVQEMLHGLFHAFLPFESYERLTASAWGTGGCRCRQCARRAPRVLEFALLDDVKNALLERGARRALVGLFGEGWCTSEFAALPPKLRESLLKGVGKRTTPTNAFPLLFSAEHALGRLGALVDPWAGNVRDMVLAGRKVVDEVVCGQSEACFGSSEWNQIMERDGVAFEDAERVEWIMASVGRGVNERNAAQLYQTLVSSILLRPHATETDAPMLSSTSHIRVQVEQARVDLLKWIGKRWLQTRQVGGFDELEGWALKEISDNIEVPLEDLISPALPASQSHHLKPPRQSTLLRAKENESQTDSISMHSSMRVSVHSRNIPAARRGRDTPSPSSIAAPSSSTATSYKSMRMNASTSSLVQHSPLAEDDDKGDKDMDNSRPDSKLTPGLGSISLPPSYSSRFGSPTQPSIIEPEDDGESRTGDYDDANSVFDDQGLSLNTLPRSLSLDHTQHQQPTISTTMNGKKVLIRKVAPSTRRQTPSIASTATTAKSRTSVTPGGTSRPVSSASSVRSSAASVRSSAASVRSSAASVRSVASTIRKSTITGSGSNSSLRPPRPKSPTAPVPPASPGLSRPSSRGSLAPSTHSLSLRPGHTISARPTSTVSTSNASESTNSTAFRSAQSTTRSRRTSGASVTSNSTHARGGRETPPAQRGGKSGTAAAAARVRKVSTGSTKSNVSMAGATPTKRPPLPTVDTNKLSPTSVRRTISSASSVRSVASTVSTTTSIAARKALLAAGQKNTNPIEKKEKNTEKEKEKKVPVPASPLEPEEPTLEATSSTLTIKGKTKVEAALDHKKSNSTASTGSASTLKRQGSSDTITTKMSGSSHSTNKPALVSKRASTPPKSDARALKENQPLPTLPIAARGATLDIGIPCIISSKRKRFKAYARYIGEVEGEDGPWVGVEVPVNESWGGVGDRDDGERQWNDGTWGGIRYFEIGSTAGSEWDYGGGSGGLGGDDRAARRRRVEWVGSGSGSILGGKGVLKREGDQLAVDRAKRFRSVSPAVSDASGMETRGLFVRPQQVLYVVDAVGSDL